MAVNNLADVAVGVFFGRVADGRLSWLKPNHHGHRRVRNGTEEAVVNKLSRRYLEIEEFRAYIMDHVKDLQVRARQDEVDLPAILNGNSVDHLRELAMRDDVACKAIVADVVNLYPYVVSVHRDLDYIAPRLLGKDDQLYGEYDRLNAEGSFRIGLLLPLLFLVGVLAVQVSPWWACGAVVPFAFMYLGSGSWSRATETLALAAERVESPALERLMTSHIELRTYEEIVDQADQSVAARQAVVTPDAAQEQ
jgi:hypothetical protein